MNLILIIAVLFIMGVLAWALFGGNNKSKEDPSLKESTFRRRAADRRIEQDFPDEPFGRRDTDGAPAQAKDRRKEEDQFKLPYLADEIIPEFSRFRIYRRTLINSEVYAKKGDFTTAISLYEGVRSRIGDTEVKSKIEADIEYLELFKKKKEDDNRRREEEAKREVQKEKEGDSSKSSNEVRVMIDGSVPETLTIGPMPNTINIGIMDPKNAFTADTIAEKVKEKLGDMTGLSGRENLKKELENLKQSSRDEIDRMRKELENSLSQGDIAGIKDLKSEMHDLKRSVEKMGIPESGSQPRIVQPKFVEPLNVRLDTKPLMELLDRLPKQAVPPAKEMKTPDRKGRDEDSGVSTSEKVIEREQQAEDENEFELLSEYGKDKFKDELSDEEIFEKILKEKDDVSDKSFEVIGEKKVEFDEMSLTDKEIDSKKREEESFYKKLLSTDRRKTKELPILKVQYDFTRLPDDFSLSREKNILEYSFYKYKPLLVKANDFIKKRKVRDAINYYKVVMGQNIPPEFKSMIRRNISDLTDYLEKYLTGD